MTPPSNAPAVFSFRAVIDVDLVGVGDPPGYEYMYKDLYCYPET